MEITRVLRAFAIHVGVLFAVNCYAQESKAEEWLGTLMREGKPNESITLNVKITDEGPFISEMIYADTSFEFKQQEFKGDTLTFSWAPGDKDVECSLKMKDDNKYAGKCSAEDSDNTIEMWIKPDKKESELSGNEAQTKGEKEDKQKD